jgi:WD40 repeat protein/tetratricopeptide (TPR) repeat protein
MALRPQDRYASPTALAEEIERWLGDEPVSAYPESLTARLGRWVRHHKAQVAVAAAFLAILGTTALAVVFVRQAHSRQADAQTRADEKENEAKSMRELRDIAETQRARAANEQARAEAAEALAHRYRYATDMKVAQRAWDYSQSQELLALLKRYEPDRPAAPDLRGFEWHHWWRLIHCQLAQIDADAVPVTAFSPDGKSFASSGEGGVIVVRDAWTMQESFVLKGHPNKVTALAFCDDGRQLASGGQDKTVKVWDLAQRREVRSLEGHTAGVRAIAFSPGGDRLASASEDKTTRLWDARTGREVRPPRTFRGEVWAVAFSPDGKRLATGGLADSPQVWDAATGQTLFALTQGQEIIFSVAFSPDGKRLASSGIAIQLWDTTSGRPVQTLKGHNGPVTAVDFSPDGARLASASSDGTVRLWNTTTGATQFSLPRHNGMVTSVVFSPEGTRVASGSMDKTIKIWEVTHAPGVRRFPQETSGISTRITFSPDGRRLASANSFDKLVKVWDAWTGRRLLALPAHPSITAVAFSPDGNRLATAWDKTVRIWGSSSGQQFLSLEGHAGSVRTVAYASDGKRLASGGSDRTVKVWDTATGEAVLTLDNHTAGVESVTFSSDGRRLAAAAEDGTVNVWDVLSGEQVATIRGAGRVVVFSPDGKHLATAGLNAPVKVWDAASGSEQLSLQGHRGLSLAVVFSPDGRRLASGGDEGAVRVWDAVTGYEVLFLQPDVSGVSGIAFSPDGRFLAAASGAVGITIWDGESQQPQSAAARLEILKQRWLFWHQAQAEVSQQQKSWFAAAFHLSHLLQANPASSLFLTKRGAAYAELGDWARASADFAQGRKVASGDPIVDCVCSLCCLQQGDRDGYRRICTDMLGRWGQTENPDVVFHMLRCAVLVPDVVSDTAVLVRLADSAQKSRIMRHHVLKVRGAALYRAGRFEEAAEELRRAIREEGKGGDGWEQLFLAMALHQLKQDSEAHQWLNKAIPQREAEQGNAKSELTGTELDWTQRLDVAVLQLEAQALLTEKGH